MSIKNYLKSFSFFNFKESVAILIAIVARKIEEIAPRYNLIAKTKFDFFQKRDIVISKMGNENILSFISKFSKEKLFFKIRRGTTDIVIFEEILLNGGYWPVINICRDNKISPTVIVDAGANVGSSVIFFKDVFANAKIICIEPEENNLIQLKHNVELNKFTDVHFIEGGLWHKDESLEINSDFRGGKEKELSYSLSGNTNEQNNKTSIKGFSLNTILNNYGINEIDIFKIDIEGAESYLFDTLEKTKDLLSKTKVLAIELHDESIDRFKFTHFIEESGYHHITFGEVTYVYKSYKQ
jgi:FkbM family methyltransferase